MHKVTRADRAIYRSPTRGNERVLSTTETYGSDRTVGPRTGQDNLNVLQRRKKPRVIDIGVAGILVYGIQFRRQDMPSASNSHLYSGAKDSSP
jgi:hypothetical protein